MPGVSLRASICAVCPRRRIEQNMNTNMQHTPAASPELDRYLALLLQWNAQINLTAARTREALMRDHVPDALALSELIEAGSLVDVGSGAGLPALPLALLRPALRIRLVEPRAKKAAFLRTAVRELGLSARVSVDARRG